jgi:hypothetical protein
VSGPLEIDHVLVAVANLTEDAAEFESRYGLDRSQHQCGGARRHRLRGCDSPKVLPG